MEIEIDHYKILGLETTGEERSKLTLFEIAKAYNRKALEIHPDKRPNDPNAVVEFQQLKSSYEILKAQKGRKLFDDLNRRTLYNLEERERSSPPDFNVRRKGKRAAKLFMEKIKRDRAKLGETSSGRGMPTQMTPLNSDLKGEEEEEGKSEGLDGEKVLNPLLVLPLNKPALTVSSSPFPPMYVEPEVPVSSNLVGASYQAKKAPILDKLREAAEKQK